MADGVDAAAGAFATEIAPASRPRDTQGKPIRETQAPEPMFQLRPVEGDPITGDTSDGGDDPAYASLERKAANGYEPGNRRSPAEAEGEGRERRGPNRAPQRHDADADDGYDLFDGEPENISAESESDAPEGDTAQDEDGEDAQRFEITVDGQKLEVTLREALSGYIRQETFHQRMAQLQEATRSVEAEHNQLQQGWAMWNKARLDYEEDVANMLPREPDWEREFETDPRAAHAKQKVFQIIYGNLARSQQARAQREAEAADERDRRTQKYAVSGFEKFVMNHLKWMPDEPTLKRNIQSMRRTAMAEGFNELEIATTYDPRMLGILWKASKYDRMTAAAPRAVVTGKGRTLAPGAATPFNGNARRSGYDDAQRQLAKSGKVSDAAEVFRYLT